MTLAVATDHSTARALEASAICRTSREGQGTHCMVLWLNGYFWNQASFRRGTFYGVGGAPGPPSSTFPSPSHAARWAGLAVLSGRRGPGEGWQGKEEGRSRPFKSRGAEPCDLQGGTYGIFYTKKVPIDKGNFENYIIRLITIL